MIEIRLDRAEALPNRNKVPKYFGVEVKEGNPYLFAAFITMNLFIFMISMGVIGCSITLFILTKDSTNGINICTMILGIFLAIFTMLALKMRSSLRLLQLYLCILDILFVSMIIVTVFMFVQRDYLIEQAAQYFTKN